MRLHRSLLLIGLVAMAGCGGSDGPSGGGAGGADPAQAVPADAPVYVEAVVRPGGEEGEDVEALLDRFLGDREISDFIDESLAEEDKTYAQDIEPWLGQRIGFGVLDFDADEPTYIGAVAVTDAEKAEAAIAGEGEKASTVGDVQLYKEDDTFAGVTEDFILFAETEDNVRRAIETADGDGLADAERFGDAMGDLPEERLGALFVDTQALGDLAAQDPSVDPAARGVLEEFFADGEPITAALTAEDDSATVESRVNTEGFGPLGALAGGEAPELVADAPAGTWAVVGYQDVGTTLQTLVDTFAGAFGGAALTGQIESQTGLQLERDVYSWIGDLAVFVQGDSMQTLTGAVVIEASDADAAKAAVPRLVAAAERSGAPVAEATVEGADQAYTVPAAGAPGPVVLAEGDGRVVLAFGADAAAEALAPSETIADTGLYERAQESIDGIAPSAIVDFTVALKLAEESGATSDPDYEHAKPYLDQIDLIATGAEPDGEQLRSLVTVLAK